MTPVARTPRPDPDPAGPTTPPSPAAPAPSTATATEPATVDVEHLTMRYGDTTALHDVTFRLEGGKIYGLLGRNGAGKSTLMAVLAAFRKVTEGTATVDGAPIFENPAVTRRICLVRETGDTVEKSESVASALGFAARYRAHWDGDYADHLVERFKLPLKTHIGKLSHGQRCALGVTLGLASRAPLTMFDESYLGMDAPSRYAFYDELLTDYMAHPRTVVVSTHLIEEISSLFEEVLILDRGRLVVHEEAEVLRSRGVAVTGPTAEVDRFVMALDGAVAVLGSQQLGPTRSITVYGDLGDPSRAAAQSAGLELGPIALQDLFIHLTEPDEPDEPEAGETGEPESEAS